LTCEVCRHELAEAEAYIVSVRQASDRLLSQETARVTPERTAAPRPWIFARLVPILATAAIALLALVSWQFFGRNAGPPLAIQLMTTRGASSAAQAPSGRPLQLQPDLEGLPVSNSDRLEIAGQTGNVVWSGALRASVLVPSMRPGLYFVRVRRNSGEVFREYALEIEAR
jgi:hypothetical protein